MPGKLTAIVVADRVAGDRISVWEGLESASAVSDEMILVDMGMDDAAALAVDEFRRLKRCCPIISYDSMEEMLLNVTFDTKWCVVLFIDEIIHEASRHFIGFAGRKPPDSSVGMNFRQVSIATTGFNRKIIV